MKTLVGWKLGTLVAAALVLSACRTNLSPAYREKQEEIYRAERTCNVRQFESATDLPAGAKSLGWVLVEEQEGGDLPTQEALVQKVCELGGNAYSQPSWVKEGDSDKPQLKANAWSLP